MVAFFGDDVNNVGVVLRFQLRRCCDVCRQCMSVGLLFSITTGMYEHRVIGPQFTDQLLKTVAVAMP